MQQSRQILGFGSVKARQQVRRRTCGGPTVGVTTSTRPDGWVELRVANSGPAIPRYEVPGLFEPFHRYRSERLFSPGAGLGLRSRSALFPVIDRDSAPTGH